MKSDSRSLDSLMFAYKYLVRELLQGNNPHALKQQYAAKRQASDHEHRKEYKKRKKIKKQFKRQ